MPSDLRELNCGDLRLLQFATERERLQKLLGQSPPEVLLRQEIGGWSYGVYARLCLLAGRDWQQAAVEVLMFRDIEEIQASVDMMD